MGLTISLPFEPQGNEHHGQPGDGVPLLLYAQSWFVYMARALCVSGRIRDMDELMDFADADPDPEDPAQASAGDKRQCWKEVLNSTLW